MNFHPTKAPHIRPAEDGAYPDILDIHYHQWTGCSKSRLFMLSEGTPAHVDEELRQLGPEAGQSKFTFGSAGHIFVLQPHLFDDWVQVGPCNNRTLSAWKTWSKKAKAKNPWALQIRPDEALEIEWAALALDKHPEAGPLIRGAEHLEMSCVWSRPMGEYVLRMKARLDVVSKRSRVLADLKFTEDASPDGHRRISENLRYDWQDLIHTEAAVTTLGIDPIDLEFWFILIERAKPPRRPKVVIRPVEAKWPNMAFDEVEPLLDIYAMCERTNVWPGYPTGTHPTVYGDYMEQQIKRNGEQWRELAAALAEQGGSS